MSRHPGAEWIPAAWLLPSWFVRAAVALIEEAVVCWDDEDEEVA